jgi:Flp pilus assembly protein TadB
MTSALQLSLLAGALIGLGLALLIWRFAPAQPDLADTLDRLSPERSLALPTSAASAVSRRDRIGLWVMRRLPLAAWGAVPHRELAMIRMPLHRYYADKAIYAAIGLLFPPVAVAILAILGVQLPIAIPLIASIALAVLMSFLPNYNVRSDATKAREEFRRALGAYIDLVALERNTGAGPRQALEYAADVGDSWVFQRISEELARSRWSGVTPWESLTALSTELDLPELADLSDIMRLSGEEGAAVYQTLRARSLAMRAAQLSTELGKANAANERMSAPVAALAIIFMLILLGPAVLRVFTGAP